MAKTFTSAEIIQRLTRDGWRKASQKGSHVKFKHPSRPGRVVVPHPRKDIPAGTLKSIFDMAGWDWPP